MSTRLGGEVRVQVVLVEGNKSLVMGASTKGARHYIITSGTTAVLGQAKDIVFGQGAGVGEVARFSYVLLLSKSQKTG